MVLEIDTLWRLKQSDDPVFAKITQLEEHRKGHIRVTFKLWDTRDPGWQEGASLTQKFFREMYGDEPVTGWDNDSVDPEYHEPDHDCKICK